MKWIFQPSPAGQVESDVTQRDQFSNDAVTLTETIVRESVQNSLDAADNDCERVQVTFRRIDESHGLTESWVRRLIGEQKAHATAAGLAADEVDFGEPEALVIEDFGTSGLTGKTHGKDAENFSDFWRRHGKSHKKGRSRGRWGLGKLVYSTSSKLGVFFGLTRRQGDDHNYLMGQSVLNLYEKDGMQYPPHSFFADQTDPRDPYTNLPVPIEDAQLVREFYDNFCLQRGDRSGLSLVIPFPDDGIDPRAMIRVAIEAYFFPIVSGQLILTFDEIEINKSTIRQLAHDHAARMYDRLDELFDFIEGIERETNVLELRDTWADDKKLGVEDFEADDLARLKERFGNGEICSVKLPLTVERKLNNGRRGPASVDRVVTYVSAHIQRPDAITKGLDLYVRGGLTLPGESKFKARVALGVMVAEDDAICDFLGDAENPAHTQWNRSTEKLKKKYRNPSDTVKVIQMALINLYELLAEIEEIKDDKVLGRFFAMQEDSGKKLPRGSSGSKDGDDGGTPDPEDVKPPPRKKMIDVQRISGGFRLKENANATKSRLPILLRIRMAYANGAKNPFKGYSPHDFTVGKGGPITVENSSTANSITSASQNVIQLHIAELPVCVDLTGFDEARDLIVDVQSQKIPDSADLEVEL